MKTTKSPGTKKGTVAKKATSGAKQKKIRESSKKSHVEEKNKYEARIVEAIDGIDEKIDHLKKESVRFQETAKAKMDEQIIFLSKKKDELQATLKDLREHSGERWHDFKEGIEKGVEEMEEEAKELLDGVKSGFNYLISKFKKKP